MHPLVQHPLIDLGVVLATVPLAYSAQRIVGWIAGAVAAGRRWLGV